VSFLDRIAGAPCTWGVEVSPDWGYRMDRDRVLSEMAEVGLAATELGPEGFLPNDVVALKSLLTRYRLDLVGGFVPVVLYRADDIESQLASVERAAKTMAGVGASIMILGPDSHHPGHDDRIEMEESEWDVFLPGLERTVEIADRYGLVTALHPHWGMAIERRHHIERILDQTDVALCIDTGHLALAGIDPVEMVELAAGRVAHVHLKEVDPHFARLVRDGELKFHQAVLAGLFAPLGGGGGADIKGVIGALEAAGYVGWYVLEQDVALDGEPEPGAGPVHDAMASFAYLKGLADEQRGG